MLYRSIRKRSRSYIFDVSYAIILLSDFAFMIIFVLMSVRDVFFISILIIASISSFLQEESAVKEISLVFVT